MAHTALLSVNHGLSRRVQLSPACIRVYTHTYKSRLRGSEGINYYFEIIKKYLAAIFSRSSTCLKSAARYIVSFRVYIHIHIYNGGEKLAARESNRMDYRLTLCSV